MYRTMVNEYAEVLCRKCVNYQVKRDNIIICPIYTQAVNGKEPIEWGGIDITCDEFSTSLFYSDGQWTQAAITLAAQLETFMEPLFANVSAREVSHLITLVAIELEHQSIADRLGG